MSSGDLADALEFARASGANIHSLTIVRNGAIVLDAYFYPFTPETRHDLASATKSVLSILVGLATADAHFKFRDMDLQIAASEPTELGTADLRGSWQQ